jgi:hypothetical protein
MDKHELAQKLLNVCRDNDVDPAMAGEALVLCICTVIKMRGKNHAQGAAIISRMINEVLEIER